MFDVISDIDNIFTTADEHPSANPAGSVRAPGRLSGRDVEGYQAPQERAGRGGGEAGGDLQDGGRTTGTVLEENHCLLAFSPVHVVDAVNVITMIVVREVASATLALFYYLFREVFYS